MNPIFKFILTFAISIVLTFILITNISNPFLKSFIIAIAISVIVTKEND